MNSGADIDAIVEPISNFLGGKDVYLPTIRPLSLEQVQSFDGRFVKCHGKVYTSPIL